MGTGVLLETQNTGSFPDGSSHCSVCEGGVAERDRPRTCKQINKIVQIGKSAMKAVGGHGSM